MKKTLGIFIDESGDFWSVSKRAQLLVVSFAWRASSARAIPGLEQLNAHLSRLGHAGMFHTAPLIHGSGKYANTDIRIRRSIFWAFYYFAQKSDINYQSFIIDTRYCSEPERQREELLTQIKNWLATNAKWLGQYDLIKLHYDDGQPGLTKTFTELADAHAKMRLEISHEHKKTRVFQVADYATYIDRLIYKLQNNIAPTRTEKQFFMQKSFKMLKRETKK